MCDDQFVGCYHNWDTATAGTGMGGYGSSGAITPTPANTDAVSSICPADWVLPQGGTSGDFYRISSEYPTAAQMFVSDPRTAYDNVSGTSIPGSILSSYCDATGSRAYAANSYYWSRTAFSNGFGYVLYISNSNVTPTYHDSKYYAFSIRCLVSP